MHCRTQAAAGDLCSKRLDSNYNEQGAALLFSPEILSVGGLDKLFGADVTGNSSTQALCRITRSLRRCGMRNRTNCSSVRVHTRGFPATTDDIQSHFETAPMPV